MAKGIIIRKNVLIPIEKKQLTIEQEKMEEKIGELREAK